MRPRCLLALLALTLSASAPVTQALSNESFQPRTGAPQQVIPTEIRIDAIRILAPVEQIEIIAGVMQSPSNLAWAGWYQESARLGESGNLVITGYYFWNGLPALFAALQLLSTGDIVAIMGSDGTVYQYRVAWVRTYEKATAPLQEIVGSRSKEELTLITDAGEYDYAAGMYPESTVVRAKRVA